MPSFKDVFNRQLCQRNLVFALAFANGCSYYRYRNLCSCTVDLDGGGMYIAEYQTGLIGTLTLGADERGLVGCWFENGRFYLGGVDEPLVRDASFPALRQAAAWLERYFAGEKPPVPELALAPRGTAFQRQVWKALEDIPYGEVVTYGDVAARVALALGRRTSARAVGGAVGRNPLGIIVPCHRVVGASGDLTGFGGGIPAKIALLTHEGVDVARLKEAVRRGGEAPVADPLEEPGAV